MATRAFNSFAALNAIRASDWSRLEVHVGLEMVMAADGRTGRGTASQKAIAAGARYDRSSVSLAMRQIAKRNGPVKFIRTPRFSKATGARLPDEYRVTLIGESDGVLPLNQAPLPDDQAPTPCESDRGTSDGQVPPRCESGTPPPQDPTPSFSPRSISTISPQSGDRVDSVDGDIQVRITLDTDNDIVGTTPTPPPQPAEPDKPKPPSKSAEVIQIWEHFIDKRAAALGPNRAPRLTDSTKRKIKTRLKSFEAEEITEAIDVLFAAGSWHVENGHTAPRFVFRSDDQIEVLRAKAAPRNSYEAQEAEIQRMLANMGGTPRPDVIPPNPHQADLDAAAAKRERPPTWAEFNALVDAGGNDNRTREAM